MERKRIECLENALDFLKERLSTNVNKIRNNTVLSKSKITENPLSQDLSELKIQNEAILNENKEILNLQFIIQKYISIYNNDLHVFQEERKFADRSAAEWFELTINDVVSLNEHHPFYNDKEFLADLLNFYKHTEMYEKCQEIVALMNNID